MEEDILAAIHFRQSMQGLGPRDLDDEEARVSNLITTEKIETFKEEHCKTTSTVLPQIRLPQANAGL